MISKPGYDSLCQEALCEWTCATDPGYPREMPVCPSHTSTALERCQRLGAQWVSSRAESHLEPGPVRCDPWVSVQAPPAYLFWPLISDTMR